MKAIVKTKPKKPKAGSVGKISLLAKHPMHTGILKDKKGKIIPANFINKVEFYFDGNHISTINGTQTVSENPFYSMKMLFTKSGKLEAKFTDNLGNSYSKSKKLKLNLNF